MHFAVIAAGCNLGACKEIICRAIKQLGAEPHTQIHKVSSFYRSVALTMSGRDKSAPCYTNLVFSIHTALTPFELLRHLQKVEHLHGRQRTKDVKWEDRTLDLDIIDYEGIQLNTTELALPHPQAHLRNFVLIPWLEIDPKAVIPGKGPVRDLCEQAGMQNDLWIL